MSGSHSPLGGGQSTFLVKQHAVTVCLLNRGLYQWTVSGQTAYNELEGVSGSIR